MIFSARVMRWVLAVAILMAAGVTLSTPVLAIDPTERLADPQLERRARAISANLRCLVCQNQSIDDSDAPLARDLRLIVRERLMAGDSDSEVIDFVVARYGEFVLLSPRFGGHTLLLWIAPLILLAGGLVLVWYSLWGRARVVEPASAPLTQAERDELEQVLRQRR